MNEPCNAPDAPARRPAAGQAWDAERYARDTAFVSALGMPVLECLAPRPGERVLDVGCGDGTLMQALVDRGCEVVGIDPSEEMVEKARRKGLDAQVVAAESMGFEAEFDALFSNATLHWVRDIEAAMACCYRALRPGGRFVGEFGARGNVQLIVDALSAEFSQRQEYGSFTNPWNFPSSTDFGALLQQCGFMDVAVAAHARPTPLPNGMRAWLDVFTSGITAHLDEHRRVSLLDAVERRLADTRLYTDDSWQADYVRLRFSAIRHRA